MAKIFYSCFVLKQNDVVLKQKEADKFDSRSVIPTESVRLHDDAKVQPVVHPNLFSQFPCNLRGLPLD